MYPQHQKNSTIFKTWLSDINKVALAIDGLQNIAQFKTGSTIANGMELSTVAVNKYKASIEGLTLSQAALNEAQQNQILISAGLITSTDSVTAANVKQAVAENVLTTAKQQEVLATFEAEMAEGKMSLERLQSIALDDTEAGAIARVILAKKEENVQNLKNIASGKALTTVLKEQLLALATNPMTWVVAGLAGVVTVAYQCSQAIEEVETKAQELNETFSTSKTEIEDYKTQIDDLYKVINDSGSSIEDVTTARQNLMTIQDQLIEKFGDEKDAIDLITDSINGQTDALNILTEAQWQIAKNEFNKSGFWGNVSNFSEGYSDNIDRMLATYERHIFGIDMSKYSSIYTKDTKELSKMLRDEFGATISDSSPYVYLQGDNVLELQQQILDIQKKLQENNENGQNDKFIDYLGDLERSLNDTREKYEDFYKQYVLYERIFANNTLTDSYKKINDAYSEYQNAFATGDEESIKKAQDNFASILTQATEGVSDESVVDFFNDMYPDLKEVVGNWQFETNFTANTDGLKDDVSGYLSRLDGLYSYDLKNFSYDTATEEQKASYDGLISVARIYDLTIDQLIDKLALMGLVQDENYKKLVDLFGQEAVDKLTPEDLEIAYSISSKEADKALEQEKNKIKSELESLSKEGNVDLTIRPVIDSSAMQAAGWDVEDGSIATTFTQGEFIWQGDEENGQYVYVHYTPILPDGTVLTPDELTDYLYGTLEGSQSVLDADNKGIVLKVDTDLQGVSAEDIKQLQENGIQTDGMQSFLNSMGQWDDSVHTVQESYYDTGESIDYASNALDGLIEKHKQLDSPAEFDIIPSLSNIESDFDKIKTVYEEFTQEGFKSLSATTVNDLTETFGKLNNGASLDKFNKEIILSGGNVDRLKKALNNLATDYIYSSDLVKGLTESNKDYVQTELEKMGVINAEEVVQEALRYNLNSLEEAQRQQISMYEQLPQRQAKALGLTKDLEEATWAETVQIMNSAEALNADANCFAQLAAQKLRLNQTEINTTRDISSLAALADQIGATTGAVGALQKAKELMSQNTTAGVEYYKAVVADIRAKLSEALKPAKIQYSPTPKSSGGGSGGSGTSDTKKEFSDVIDWIEVKIESLQQKIDSLMKTITSYASFAVKKSALAKSIDMIHEKISLEEKALQSYESHANAIDLSADYKRKVQDGDLSIETITDENLSKKISEYKEVWQKIVECKDAIQDLKTTEQDYIKQSVELSVTQLTNKKNRLDAKQEKLQDTIDYKEVAGKGIKASDYEKLLKNSNLQKQNIDEQNKELKKYLATLDSTSDEYENVKAQIEDNEKSLRDIKKQQAEWNKTLAEMPITIIDRAIDKIERVRTELENLISLRETQKRDIDDDTYKKQIKQSQDVVSLLEKKIKAKKDEMKKLGWDEDSTEYQNALKDISDLETQIMQEKIKQEQYLDAILDNRIKKLQEEKERIQDINNAKQKALELEKLQQALEKAKNNKTNLVYRQGLGWVREADQDSIKEAQDALDNFYYQALLDKFDKAIEDIEALKEKWNLYDENGNLQTNYLKTISGMLKDVVNLTSDLSKEVGNIFKKDTPGKKTVTVLSYKDDDKFKYVSKSDTLSANGQDLMKLVKDTSIFNDSIEKLMELKPDTSRLVQEQLRNIQFIPDTNMIKSDRKTQNNITLKVSDISLPNVTNANDFVSELKNIALNATQRANRR